MHEQYPFDSEFQDKLLYLLLTDFKVIGALDGIVQVSYFTDPDAEIVADGVMKFYRKYSSAPTQHDIVEWLRSSYDSVDFKRLKARVSRIVGGRYRNTEFVRDEAIKFGRFQAMRKAILECSDLVESPDNYTAIQKLIGDAASVGSSPLDKGTDLFLDRNKRYAAREIGHDDVHRIRTGFPSLDKKMNGGLDRGELGCVMGPPKGFKSGMLINLGTAAMRQRIKVVHYTLEISERNTVTRYDRCIGNVDRTGLVAEWDKVDKVLERINKIGGGCVVKGFPSRSVDPLGILNHVNLLKREGFFPGMVIVDYGDLLLPSRSYGERRHELSLVYQELRGLAQSLEVPLWTATQASKKSLSQRVITKEHVAEDFGKIAISDTVIANCQTDSEKRLTNERMRIFMAANREGSEQGVVYCGVDKDRMKIRELDKSEISHYEIEDDDGKANKRRTRNVV